MKKPASATRQGVSSLLYRPTRPNSHSRSEGGSRARAVTNLSHAAESMQGHGEYVVPTRGVFKFYSRFLETRFR